MTINCLCFEAKSIQDYLLQSGRLRDVIGASELVDSLTGELLDQAIEQLELRVPEDVAFFRRAGGAFYAFSHNNSVLDHLTDLWTLLVQQFAPGMSYDLGRGEDKGSALTAFDKARESMHADGARRRPRLPLAAPITLRSRRTGLAAEALDSDEVAMDAATLRKRRLDFSRADFIGRFAPEDAELDWRDWPRDLEPGEDGAFPFVGDRRTLALIHADGNGLGQLMMNARQAATRQPDAFMAIFSCLSRIISESTEQAAKQATNEILLPHRANNGLLPARPILLGGDDLTILVRGDLGLSFLTTFAAAFEAESRARLPTLADLGLTDLPPRLSIGAGLVWLRASQPFYLASQLAESLITLAKRKAKACCASDPPSAVAFHRVTTALVDDYDIIVEWERTHHDGGNCYVDTAGPYLLGDNRSAQEVGPWLDDLLELQRVLQADGMARGPTRQLLTLLGLDLRQARASYQRWRQLMVEHQTKRLNKLDDLLGRLIAWPMTELPFGHPLDRPDDDGLRVSPLGDAIALMSVDNQLTTAPTDDADEKEAE